MTFIENIHGKLESIAKQYAEARGAGEFPALTGSALERLEHDLLDEINNIGRPLLYQGNIDAYREIEKFAWRKEKNSNV